MKFKKLKKVFKNLERESVNVCEGKDTKTYDHKSTPKDWNDRKVVDSFTEPDGSITVVVEKKPKKKKKYKDTDYETLKQDMKFFKKGMDERVRDGKPTYEKEQREIDEHKGRRENHQNQKTSQNKDSQRENNRNRDRNNNQNSRNNRNHQNNQRIDSTQSDQRDNTNNKSDQCVNKED